MKNRSPLEIAVFSDGRSKTEICKAAGIDRTTLSLALNGTRKPRLETAIRLANVLGVSPESVGLIGVDGIISEVNIEND